MRLFANNLRGNTYFHCTFFHLPLEQIKMPNGKFEFRLFTIRLN